MDRQSDDGMSNPLWDYSVATYRLDEVAQLCLGLQDDFGVDVNLLMYAGWLAHMERRLSGAHLTELEALIVDWRESVVKPLRLLRRQLHGRAPAEGIRTEIKVLELRAEQQQQDMMYAFYQRAVPLQREPEPLPENLALVARFSSPEYRGWAGTLERLGAILSQ
jgi:uncharacterized protein (TIGR02444 family)